MVSLLTVRRKERSMKRAIVAAVLITFATGSLLWAGGVDMQKFVQETQKLDRGPNSFRFVWWIPTEYWKEIFRNNPNLTEDQKKTLIRAVEDYIVFSVIDGKTTQLGSVVPASRDEIVSKFSLAIGQGKQMKPLPDAEVSSDTKNLFAMMKPVIANMLGQFGQGMEFICFQGVDSKGKRLLDPVGNVSFSATLGASTFKWRLPLGSLLPPKYDSLTGEMFPGNYIYNPFTGSKLISTPSNKVIDSDEK
jgi:hypothetical protein